MMKSENILQNRTIIFLGSSVTYGAAAGGVSFVEEIAEKCGCIAIKEAVSGTTLVDSGEESYISRMKELKVERADLFLCQLSTNDATQGQPIGKVSESTELSDFDTSTVAGAMEYIIAYARATWGCPVAFYTNPRYDSEAYEAMVELLYRLQEKWKIGVVDLWNDKEFNNITSVQYERYMADPVHPTQAGYSEWWTPVMVDALVKIL